MNKSIEERLNDLERKFKEMEDVKKKDSLPDILRKIVQIDTVPEIVSAEPTTTPIRPNDHFKLYVNGATYRLYVYADGTWKYTSLT